jgi:SanA protein
MARMKAVGDVVTGAKPRFLGPPIPIAGDGRATRG